MKVVVLDRDGVINEPRVPFLRGPEDWQPLPGAIDAIVRLTEWGWRVVLAIDQPEIGQGLVGADAMNAIHQVMLKRLSEEGGRIHAIFFCPHAPEEACACRKPRPGLLRTIAQRFGVDLTKTPVVGDTLGDLQAAAYAGAQPWLVRTGLGRQTEAAGGLPAGTQVVDDLLAFAERWIAEGERRR